MGYFYGIELANDGGDFSDDQCEWLIRRFLSKRLLELGLHCRADDRGDPVIQLAPPLVCGPAEFEAMTSIIHQALSEAWAELPRRLGPTRRHHRRRVPGAGVDPAEPRSCEGAMIDLDPTDKAIIEALQVDGRLPYSELGPMVGLSQAAVRQRVKRLLDAGVMQVVAVTDPASLGFGLQALIGITVEGDIRGVADALAEVDEIDYVVVTAGPLRRLRRGRVRKHGRPSRPRERTHPVDSGRARHRGVHLPRPGQADVLVGHPLARTGSLWADGLDDADARAGEGRPPLDRFGRSRRRHRRRRLHRLVDGAALAAGRAVDACRGARVGGVRVGRVGPQRRVGIGVLRRVAGGDGRSPRKGRRCRPAASHARRRRRPRRRRRRRGHRLRLPQGRLADLGDHAAAGGAGAGRGRGGAGLGFHRRRPPLARRRRGGEADRRGRGAGRRLHAALRPHPPGAPRARPGGRGRAPWRSRPRGHAGHADRTRTGPHGGGDRARARRGARHRGLHTGARRRPPGHRAPALPDDRHRAAARRGLGPHRVERCRDADRRPAADHLRPAHRRRPHRLRRPWRAVPVRFTPRRPVPSGRRGSGPRSRRHPGAAPRRGGRRRDPPLGRRPRRAPRLVLLGRDRPDQRAGMGRRLRRRRRDHVLPRRPHPGRPHPRAHDRADRAAVGRSPAALPGSRSPSAGWASTPGCD